MSRFYEDDENYCSVSNIILSTGLCCDGLDAPSSSSIMKDYTSNVTSTMLSSSPADLSIINLKPYSQSTPNEIIFDSTTSHMSFERNDILEEPTNTCNDNDEDDSNEIEGLDQTVFRVANDISSHDNNNESDTNEEADRSNNSTVDYIVDDHNNTVIVNESTPERIAREERESQELAWELMRQDNLEVYSMQMQFMQDNADNLSAEDFALIQSLMNESAQQNVVVSRDDADEANEDDEQGEDNDGDDEDNDGIDENDPNTWDYERLLALGQQIGDVKTERWRLRSRRVIDQLKKLIYKDIVQCKTKASVTETAAVVASLVHSNIDIMINNDLQVCSPTIDRSDAEEEQSSSNKKPCIRSEINTPPCCDALLFNADTTNNSTLVDSTTTTKTKCDISGGDVDRCVVCMEDFELSDLLLQLPCKHYFHVPCTEVSI